MKKNEREDEIKESVRNRYGDLAQTEEGDTPRTEEMIRVYSHEELEEIPDSVKASVCSCGNPVALAEFEPGQVVVDLGSGAGMDVFLAARKVSPGGRAIGIDSTPEMLWKARNAAENMKLDNAEFRLGEIEHIPVESNLVDVVISNCVINLSTDKRAVFEEVHRILRPGGKLVFSDRILVDDLPDEAMGDEDLWGGCISGALSEEECLSLIGDAGFVNTEIIDKRTYSEDEARSFLRTVQKEKEKKGEEIDPDVVIQSYLSVANARIVAYKGR